MTSSSSTSKPWLSFSASVGCMALNDGSCSLPDTRLLARQKGASTSTWEREREGRVARPGWVGEDALIHASDSPAPQKLRVRWLGT